MKHILPAPRPKRERTLQLNVVRKESAPSGKEELHSESIMITVNEGEDEPAKVKPGRITVSHTGLDSVLIAPLKVLYAHLNFSHLEKKPCHNAWICMCRSCCNVVSLYSF